jgi:hypothetical protein
MGVRAEAADLSQAGPNPAACPGLAGRIGKPPSDSDRTARHHRPHGTACACEGERAPARVSSGGAHRGLAGWSRCDVGLGISGGDGCDMVSS